MAHLYAPRTSIPDLPVFFNVHAVVGAQPAENRREDVLLVQFAFKVIATSPSGRSGPEKRAAASAVRVTGTIDAETINAIRASQRDKKGRTVDGRVSPARGGYAYAPGGAWQIVVLNNDMQDVHLDIWPRIDKITNPACPGELIAMVKREVVGV